MSEVPLYMVPDRVGNQNGLFLLGIAGRQGPVSFVGCRELVGTVSFTYAVGVSVGTKVPLYRGTCVTVLVLVTVFFCWVLQAGRTCFNQLFQTCWPLRNHRRLIKRFKRRREGYACRVTVRTECRTSLPLGPLARLSFQWRLGQI